MKDSPPARRGRAGGECSYGQEVAGRYLAAHEAGLGDRSSKPALSPRQIEPGKALATVELRRKRLTHARNAEASGVSKSTVSRVLTRMGLSKLSDLERSGPWCATNTMRQAICCTWTPRSLGEKRPESDSEQAALFNALAA